MSRKSGPTGAGTFANEAKAAMALPPAAAAQRLLRLAKDSQTRRSIDTDWEAEQALALAAAMLDEAGDRPAAVRVYRRLERLHRVALSEHGHALASIEAALANRLFAMGRHRAAERAAVEALRLAGYFGEPSLEIENAISSLRAYWNSKPGRAPTAAKRKAGLRRT